MHALVIVMILSTIIIYQVMLLLNIYIAAMDACNYNNLVMNILRRHPMHNLELFPILWEAKKFHVRIRSTGRHYI